MEAHIFVIILVGLPFFELACYHNTAAHEISPDTCPELIASEGVNLTCENEQGDSVNCLERSEKGTTAYFSCLPFYENERKSFKMICNSNGRWFPSRSFECQVDCGRQNSDFAGHIANGYVSNATNWPWHVTIFRKSKYYKDPLAYHYICGGALISPSLVLTAAHCLVSAQNEVTPPEKLRVALFAESSNFRTLMSSTSAKVLQVSAFEYHSDFQPDNYDNDIALLKLSENVEFSRFIRPVCYPHNNEKSMRLQAYHVSTSSSGYIVGFGVDETGKVSGKLKETKIPVISTRDCADVVGKVHNGDQYCAGYLNGTAACSGDSGGGMYFSYKTAGEERFVVQGLVSHAKRGKCDSFTIFANVANYAQWIEDMEFKFHTVDVENDKKKQNCAVLQVSPNVVVKCYENPALSYGVAKLIPCQRSRPKDIAKFGCTAHFMEKILLSTGHPTPNHAHPNIHNARLTQGVAVCQDNGLWSKFSIECEPECGKFADHLPWQAKIFLFSNRKNAVGRGYLCGGALIESSIILTSASCLLTAKGGKIPYAFLRIVLGSNHSELTVDFSDRNLQILTVQNVWIAPTFNFTTLSGNLALIQMTSNAQLTKNVKRVCYLRQHLDSGQEGFEATLPNYLSNLRTETSEKVIKSKIFLPKECNSTLGIQIGSTQYCSALSPSVPICKNDTGSGLVRITSKKDGQPGLSILKGVLSHGYVVPEVKTFCSLNSHVVFEQIEPHGQWIQEKIAQGIGPNKSDTSIDSKNQTGIADAKKNAITPTPATATANSKDQDSPALATSHYYSASPTTTTPSEAIAPTRPANPINNMSDDETFQTVLVNPIESSNIITEDVLRMPGPTVTNSSEIKIPPYYTTTPTTKLAKNTLPTPMEPMSTNSPSLNQSNAIISDDLTIHFKQSTTYGKNNVPVGSRASYYDDNGPNPNTGQTILPPSESKLIIPTKLTRDNQDTSSASLNEAINQLPINLFNQLIVSNTSNFSIPNLVVSSLNNPGGKPNGKSIESKNVPFPNMTELLPLVVNSSNVSNLAVSFNFVFQLVHPPQ